MSSVLEEDKLVALTGTASLGKCRFTYSPGMQKQWVESISVFLDFIGSRCGQSAKASLEARELIVAEVDEKCLKKFETEAQEKTHLNGLKH